MPRCLPVEKPPSPFMVWWNLSKLGDQTMKYHQPIRAVLFSTLAIVASLSVSESDANAASSAALACHSVVDLDERAFCQARTTGRKSYCHVINNKDGPLYCYAVVTRDTGYCARISDRDFKKQCRRDAR